MKWIDTQSFCWTVFYVLTQRKVWVRGLEWVMGQRWVVPLKRSFAESGWKSSQSPQRSLGNDSSTPLSSQGRLPPWTTYTKSGRAAQDFCTVLYGIWENNCAALLDHFFSSSKWNTCISSVPALCSSLFSSAAALLSTVASLHLASSSSSSLHSSEGHNLH